MRQASGMLSRGVYPAAVTPLLEGGNEIDTVGLKRLLQRFEAASCSGVVLAGTNGEGPSLSNREKLDLLALAGQVTAMPRILGVATPSCVEAAEICESAGEATAILLMPPSYFRDVNEVGLERWFTHVLDRSPVPILIYNFPQRTGVVLTGRLLAVLASHDRCIGAKDSSGDSDNLASYAAAMPGKLLFVGDETLLFSALDCGWAGTISGAANLHADKLTSIVSAFDGGRRDEARVQFDALLPDLRSLRARRQPVANKRDLHQLGVLTSSAVRTPLTED